MNRTIFAKVRTILEPTLDATCPTGSLSERDRSLLAVLYRDLSGDLAADPGPYLERLDQRVRSEPGLLAQTWAGLELLRSTGARLFPGVSFVDLTPQQRERVLSRLLRRNRSQMAESSWRRRARMTQWHLAQVFSLPRHRAFRRFVVQEIVTDYFNRPEGWALVGYREFPGRARVEWEPCEVTHVHETSTGGLLLELSDGTFDELSEHALVDDPETVLAAITKSGRQRARFSRAAYRQLGQYLEENDAGDLVVRLGDRTWPVERSHD
jgi:hypothetical protein